MRKIRITIFQKILTTYLILIVAVMSVIAILLSWGFNYYVFMSKQEEMHAAALETGKLIDEYYGDKISHSELNNSLDILSNMTGARIYAISLKKEALENRNLILDQAVVDDYLVNDLNTILSGQEVSHRKQYSNHFGTNVIFTGIPLTIKSEIQGAILLFAPLDEISASIAKMNLIILVCALIAVTLSGFVIYLISLKITRPIRKLEEGIGKLAAGEQIEDITVETGDELGELAQAFNRMKNRITAAESIRREFIAGISHDLRTPLTTINGFVQGMLEGLVRPGDSTRYLRIIQEETQRLIGLTGDLLEYAKLQSGGVILSRKYLNLRNFFEALIDNTGIKYNEKNINISLDCPEGLELYADEARLKQIIINILDNALKFSPEEGKILIKVTVSEDSIIVGIKDNGPGIDPQDMPFIFEKFYRADKSRQVSTGGTGLGLNIAKSLVELHGGVIKAHSNIGQGTEILFTFPR